MTTSRLFTDRKIVFALAITCCLLWGSAYPAIKGGYELFSIAANDVPSKLVFAGWRFAFAGLLLLVVAAFGRKPIFDFNARTFRQLTLLGLTQTSLQYVFFYIGLAYTTGVKGSILNGTGTFFSVLLAHFIYHNDRLSRAKAIGCAVGFAGVMVVNFGRGILDFDFTLLGEGFVVIAAFVLAAASIYGKKVSQHMDSVVMTGWQLAIGGVALLGVGWATGGSLEGFTLASTALLIYMVLLSSVAFSLWSILLKYNRVSLVTAFNFMVPVFGTVLSAMFLHESILEWKNAAALALVCLGIWLVTREEPPAPATR
ncbi:MAG: DMT family transporter [Ideonella sp.]